MTERYSAVNYEAFLELMVRSTPDACLPFVSGACSAVWLTCASSFAVRLSLALSQRTINEDENSPGQVLEAFQAVAGDKPYVTELDLRLADLPAGALEFFAQNVPRYDRTDDDPQRGDGGEEEPLDYVAFMSSLVP